MLRDKGARGIFVGTFMAVLIMLPVTAVGGPLVKDIIVSDVTTRSFSVIWASSEASYADDPYLYVYDDPDGLVSTSNIVITPQPVESSNNMIATLAEDNGVIKVRVTGVLPGTTYYLQTVTTSKDTDETTIYPEITPYISVTTETLTKRNKVSGEEVIPFSNDLIISGCYLEDGVTPAEGTILIATVEGADYPVSAFVGDGVDPPYALIDLNNMFDREEHESFDVTEGKNLTLVNFRGMLGNAVITHRVPEDEGLSEIKQTDPALFPGWNMISFQLEPDDTDTEAVLAPIWDNFSSIWEYDTQSDIWFRYDRLGPSFLNDLWNLHACEGYWIYMDGEDSLSVEGQFHYESVPIYTDWNLVGYHSLETWAIPEVMEDIETVLECIWSYNSDLDIWLRYCTSGPPFLNDLAWVTPGKAYWIYSTGYGDW